MTHDIVGFLGTAWDGAKAAGEIIRASWQQPKTVDYKGAIDLVTSVDKECENKIVETIRSSYPDHSILAEEETDHKGAKPGSSIRWTAPPTSPMAIRNSVYRSLWNTVAK